MIINSFIEVDLINKYAKFLSFLMNMDYVPSIKFNEKLPLMMKYFYNYSEDIREIQINPDLVNNDVMFFMGMAHEMRHAAQFAAIEVCDEKFEILEPDLVDAIMENLENYIEAGQEGYREQIIELDAFGFAHLVMRKIFGIELSYNKSFTDKQINSIKKYADKLEEKYRDEDFAESLRMSGFRLT